MPLQRAGAKAPRVAEQQDKGQLQQQQPQPQAERMMGAAAQLPGSVQQGRPQQPHRTSISLQVGGTSPPRHGGGLQKQNVLMLSMHLCYIPVTEGLQNGSVCWQMS
jgi:hypothetical protein